MNEFEVITNLLLAGLALTGLLAPIAFVLFVAATMLSSRISRKEEVRYERP